jgi:hypothetical protein
LAQTTRKYIPPPQKNLQKTIPTTTKSVTELFNAMPMKITKKEENIMGELSISSPLVIKKLMVQLNGGLIIYTRWITKSELAITK